LYARPSKKECVEQLLNGLELLQLFGVNNHDGDDDGDNDGDNSDPHGDDGDDNEDGNDRGDNEGGATVDERRSKGQTWTADVNTDEGKTRGTDRRALSFS